MLCAETVAQSPSRCGQVLLTSEKVPIASPVVMTAIFDLVRARQRCSSVPKPGYHEPQ